MTNEIISGWKVALFSALFVVISLSASAEPPKKKFTLPVEDAHRTGKMTVSVYPKRAGKKFHLDQDYRAKIAVKPETDVQTGLILLDTEGNLVLRSGFSWNGANATIDTKTILRGSMVHGALYELMRNGLLDSSRWRRTADIELARICREDGMRKSRIAILKFIVYRFGEKMAKVNPELTTVDRVAHSEND